MYEAEFPEVGELVYVVVERLTESSEIYVHLPEYNKEGMIGPSELMKGRVKSYIKFGRQGKTDICVVTRVDPQKGYIDLSKKRVTSEEKVQHEQKYNKSKTVHSIAKRVSEVTHVDLVNIYTTIIWPLYKKYTHAFEAFQKLQNDNENIFNGIDIPSNVYESFIQAIAQRMKAQTYNIRSYVDVTCFSIHGIEGIKTALREGESVHNAQEGDELDRVKIRLIAPPTYLIETITNDQEFGFKLLRKSITAIQDCIIQLGGSLIVKSWPSITNEPQNTLSDSFIAPEEKPVYSFD